MWNTQQTSEKSLSKRWQSRTKVMMNNYRWNVFRVEREARHRRRVAAQNIMFSVFCFCYLWRQRLNTFLQLSLSPASHFKRWLLQTAWGLQDPLLSNERRWTVCKVGKNASLLQQSSIRNSFKTVSLHVESIVVVSDCTNLAALPLR